jgi:mono/diheme cytochrome c family protein
MRILRAAVLPAVGGLVALAFSTPARTPATTAPADPAPAPAADLLAKHCVSCHGPTKPKADFRVDTLLTAAPSEADLSAWNEVLRRLETGDMPPKGKPRPADAEYAAAVAAVRRAVEPVEAAAEAKKPRVMRRLNTAEYANTVRDLFGVRYRPGDDFPPDDALYGFDTVGEGLNLSAALVAKYLAAAENVLDRAFRVDEPGRQPHTTRYAFYEEHHTFPKGGDLRGFGIYNGNATYFFGKDGKGKVLYIGGPAVFARDTTNPDGETAFNWEGVWKLKARLTPRKFEPGELASFTVLDGRGKRAAEYDIPIKANGTEIVVEAEEYYDRSDRDRGFELNWTNGNHLQWPARGALLRLPFDNSGLNTPWWHVNYRMADGKRQDWKPQKPEELPFSYFENVTFEVTGPFREQPPQAQELLGDYPKDGDAAQVFARFLPRAFRRPATQPEVDRYAALVKKQRDAGLDPMEALKVGLSAALCSPHFLFLVETPPPDAPRGGYPLNDWELAARLSYFLWSTMPDEELLAAARAGKLKEPAELDRQVTRMLADPRSKALSDGFARQWLGLDKLASAMPEPKLFPRYDEDLRDASRAETLAVFREILTKNLPVTEFLDAKWTFLNEKLAAHYGLPPVAGRVLRRVELPDGRRGGLLTHASILTLTSEATRTAPVIRGAYVLDRLFNRPPPPPPPGVAGLIPDASQARSIREHLAIHRADPLCAGCHAKFDGYGLALENFDATGAWRTDEPAHEDPSKATAKPEGYKTPMFPIDPKADVAGVPIDGVAGLKKHLLARKDDFTRGLAERLTVYAAGRGLTAADRPHLDEVVKQTAADGYRMPALVRAVVRSPAFRTR